jgi:hypothetical protein
MTRRDDASLAIDSIVLAAELLERATRRNTSPPWCEGVETCNGSAGNRHRR